MISFEWTVFDLLAIDHFQQLFDTPDVDRWFKWWQEEYDFLARRFYQQQNKRYLKHSFHLFCHEYGLDADVSRSFAGCSNAENLKEQWQNWQDARMQPYRKTIAPYLAPVEESDRKGLRSLASLSLQKLEMVKTGWTEDEKIRAKSLWFRLNNPVPQPDQVRHLKSLPYDEYLRTKRWKRIRQSMIFIDRAVCCECHESFYGGYEIDLHVHHRHYRNFASEQYADLELLCNIHHQQHHDRSNLVHNNI